MNERDTGFDAHWKQLRGRLREEWGRITEDDLERIAGHRDRLVGVVQEKYGETKEAIHQKLEKLLGEIEKKNSG
jgi:uncharacterized protein YjbJ (UPF0337 family)